ncbi:MAG: hypothetical protein ABSF71_13390 [Terriglobia bacterium]|jgi:hypothetical protein
MTQRNGNGALPVLALGMDRLGQVRKKMLRFDQEGQLENTLIQALYPGIRVATIDILQEPLDAFEQAEVEQSLAKLGGGADTRFSVCVPRNPDPDYLNVYVPSGSQTAKGGSLRQPWTLRSRSAQLACGRSFRSLGYQNKSRHALEMREVVRNQWHGVAHGERCNP